MLTIREFTIRIQMFLAKALYDNIAETPDELAFRRGDVLTVVEQDTAGLDGWWLCSLRGRQGIAPGNRLKILSGMVTEGGGATGSKEDVHQHQDPAKAAAEWRRSLEQQAAPTKVVTPVKKGDVYLHTTSPTSRAMEDYDVPPSRYFPSGPALPGHEVYDVPTNLPAPAPGTSSSASSSFYDTPPSSKRASVERTPPGSQRASMDSLGSSSSLSYRLSGDQAPHPQHQHLYQTPPSSKRASAESGSVRLSGGERHYETPPSSKRSSLERILSDDQPTYDIPTSAKAVEAVAQAPPPLAASGGETTYDTPPLNPGSRRHSRDSTGTGSRGSMLSSASMDSCASGGSSSHLAPHRHSNTGSLPDSARSSLDASLHEPYDLPPRETRAMKQLSMDSGLGSFYDTPAPGRQNQASPQPPHFAHSSSHLSDCARVGERTKMDMKRSRSLENALDDFYDSPRNNAPKVHLKSAVQGFGSASAVNHDPNAVYDIPPQVTRDSVISARSDSSDDSQRLSTCSVDSRGSGVAEYTAVAEGIYEELLLDLDSAVELLVKLQQQVTRAASKVLTFVSSTWRTRESLQSNVYDIKVACVELKKATAEFMEFAQGTLANSARLSDRKLVSRLVRHVTPLQQQRKAVSETLRSLEDMKWQVALLAEPLEAEAPDHLGTMISLAKDLVPDVKKLASLIQGNSTLLFKRSSDLAAAQSRGADGSHVAAKPPIGPKPDVLAKLGGGGTGVGIVIPRQRTLQQRPLPPPPMSRRPLPPTPLEQKLRGLELSASQDSLNDYVNVLDDGERRYTVADDDDDDGDRDYSDLQQEYDYVQLEECDVAAQHKSKEQQLQQQEQQQQQQQSSQQTVLKNIEEEVEPPNTPSPDKTQCSDRLDEAPEKDLPETKPEPVIHHTDRMSADLGDKHLDIDTVPTKEDSSDTISPPSPPPSTSDAKDIPDGSGLPLPEPTTQEDLGMGPLNGLTMPATSQQHQQQASTNSTDLSGTSLDPSDKQVLCYYSGQLETHSTLLTNAIDAFFACIESGEPPKVFISNSKFVIVTAHKLVYISDALHRSLMNGEVRNKVMQCANHVCQCLKVSVQATKTAALQYPSVPAVQEMVDRVVDVSHAAHELKLVISQASAL
ncbi:enhancer of filamentation 1-like isoform X2 [Babylonia areolata]|uniref:enhancer of filamentation 1-like isoform X2 n=1 Tax=Babylonia areolata TaxID=304850 RepID=UPI003FCEF21A